MKIIAVKKGGTDDNYSNQFFKLDNGQVINLDQAYDLAKQGQIEGVVASQSKKGTKYIRNVNDGKPENNLDQLPTF